MLRRKVVSDLRHIYLIVFFYSLTIALTNTFLPIYMSLLGISFSSIGIIYAISAFASGMTRFTAGPIADFYSKKWLIFASLLGLPLYIYGIRLASIPQEFIFLKIFMAIIGGIFWTAIMGLFLDKIKMGTVGTNIAKRHIWGAVGSAVAGLGAGVLIDLIGFKNMFLVAELISFVPLSLTILLSEKSNNKRMPTLMDAEQEYKDVLTKKGFILLLSFGLMQSAATIIWVIYMPIYLSESIGLTASLIGVLFFANSIGKMFFHIPRGKLIDKFHAKWLIIPGFFIAWISGTIFLLIKNFIGLILFKFGFWMGNDFVWQASISRVSEMTSKKKHAGAVGLYYALTQFGMGISALVAGYMVKYIGIRKTMLYFTSSLFIFGILAWMVHKHLTWRYGNYYRRHHLIHMRHQIE